MVERESIVWPIRSGPVPQLAAGFTGRPETADGAAEALVPGAAVVLIHPDRATEWQSSSGKTTLAAGLAEALWQSARIQLLVWITATSRASILAGYVRAVAEVMGTTPVGDAEAVAARFLGWLAATERPWLVVFDGLADPADLDGLWPDGPGGSILVTSAAPVEHPGKKESPAFEVGPFSLREAMAYMTGRLAGGPHLRGGAFGLIEELSGEALALSQASSVIRSSGISCGDYQEKVSRRRKERGRTTPAEVTWTFSMEYAEFLTPGAPLLLLLASVLDGRAMPAAVFGTQAVCDYLADAGARVLADPGQVRTALQNLERSGLLTLDEQTVRMSPAVQTAIRGVMPGRTLHRAVRAAADALLDVWPDPEPHAGSADELRSCAAGLWRVAADVLWSGGCHPLLLRVGDSLDNTRLTGPAITYWSRLTETGDRLLGAAHPDALAIHDRLAGAYLAAGRPAEAVSLRQNSVGAWLRAAGPEHPGTLAARIGLGRALVAAGRAGDGVSVLTAAVSDCERLRGADQAETLAAREELADARRSAGQNADAIASYRRTLSDRERVQGARHPDTTATRQKLAETYIADGRTKDAVSHFKRALADRERMLGADHPDTIALRTRLGSTYAGSGKMAAAVRMLEQAHGDATRVLGTDHPVSLAAGSDLALALYSVGRLTDGITLLREVDAGCRRALPPGDPLARIVAETLANITGE